MLGQTAKENLLQRQALAFKLFRSYPEASLSFHAELSHADGKQLIWRMQAQPTYSTSFSPMIWTHSGA
jgi:hypothetical protein